jgi:ethanolamine utilization microcompartment shell protein EutS
MTTANLRPIVFHLPVSPAKKAFASGGLAKKAQDVRHGVGMSGDTILLHVNPQEYAFMQKHFGPERINPHTGLPQFGFFSDIAKFVLPIAASIFLSPIAGAAVNSALGLGLGAAAESALGAGLVGAGTGAITGGAKGALLGGVTGAAGSYLLGPSGLGLTGENGVLSKMTDNLGLTGSGGLSEKLGLNELIPGTTTEATKDAATKAVESDLGNGLSKTSSGVLVAENDAAVKAAENKLGQTATGFGSLAKYALPAAVLAGALTSGSSKPTQATAVNSDTNYNKPLSNVPFNRQAKFVNVDENYGYGGGSNQFFEDNKLPTVTAAQGRYVKGGGTGISDSIPARLSDGEYVIDAQTVSMLGDGSSDAGAKKLDQMREAIRRQKGGVLAKGKFPPKAKSPLSYIGGA